MQDTKLVNLISIVHKQRKNTALHKYLQRQYFKSDGLEFMLWEHIRRYVRKNDLLNKKLTRNYIETNLFNNDRSSLNRTSSRLYLRIKNFMIEGFLGENQIIQDWLFREAIKVDKSIENRLNNLVTDSLLNTERKPVNRTEQAFLLFIRFHLNYEIYQERSLENYDVELFNKVRRLFNQYFIRYYEVLEIEKEQRQRLLSEEVVDLVQLKVEKTAQNRVEALLEKAQRLETTPSNFEFCKNELINLVDNGLIIRERQLTIFPLVFNFANNQAVKGNKSYLLNNIDDFIYLGFEKQILYTKNKLSIFIYTNFLSLVAANREVEPIEDYAKRYLEDIEDKEKNKARFFTDIFIAFYKKDFERVVQIIYVNEHEVKIGFEFSMRMRIWAFLICSYFELKWEEALLSSLQSFRRYIKGQLIADNTKPIYYKFISYIRRLIRCSTLNVLRKIEADLEQEDNVFYMKWLKEKIKESYSKLS